jgi:hypothetical protein
MRFFSERKTNQQMAVIFYRGMEARHDGLELSENPYGVDILNAPEERAWAAGWIFHLACDLAQERAEQ